MTQNTDPSEQQFDALRARFEKVERDHSFAEMAAKASEITKQVGTLPDEIAKIRERGYAFAAYLEHKAGVLGEKWGAARSEMTLAIEEEANRLRPEVERVRRRVATADKMRGSAALQSQLRDIQTGVETTESLRGTAERRIRNLYETIDKDTAQTHSQITAIKWYLDQRDEASFKFLAEEALFLAAKAEWDDGKDKPDGILYLTDQRLLFEQKETTGKKLGLFGGKKTQELEWDIPLHLIESVKAENKGLFGGKDMLYFTNKTGAAFSQLTLEIKGGVSCKFWAAQIDRMIKGDTNDERAIQPDAETLEAIRSAPTACYACGGTLPQLVAGQRQMTCSYCGTVIRV